ncbi:MAG: hypothetical protein H8M99_15705 [Gloeobacteraceae cyanobacterium ES-bin-144]|nr:hypothetical protein [Verrucomicrobiales bacterium]
MKMSRMGTIVSVLPGLLGLIFFYSLAIHMHESLGDWPTGIGEAGFPPALLLHANIATFYCWTLLPVSVLAFPIIVIVCACVPRWNRFVLYVAVYALAWIVSIGLMQLAPDQYLYWWND